MLDYNAQYQTHPLYNHFKSWVDMEDDYQDSYFIINTALYAAEAYIQKQYNLTVRATPITEYFGTVSSKELQPRYSIQNLLGVYTTDGYELPTVNYYDTVTKTYEEYTGPFRLNEGLLSGATATNLNIEYITGFNYPVNPRQNAIIPTSLGLVGGEVTRPTLSNKDGSPLYSPLSTVTSFYDLYIIGDAGATIYVNGIIAKLRDSNGVLITDNISPSIVINSDRIGKITLPLIDGVNTFSITARDSLDNISDETPIIINKQAKFIGINTELVGKDLVTNTGSYKLIVNSYPGTHISVNAVDALPYSTGTDVLICTTLTTGVQDIVITTSNASQGTSRVIKTHLIYDPTLTDEQVEAINSFGFSDLEMPQDILMSILMIANHYFRIALYKHEDTQSYGDNVSNRTTFIADRFPKEAHRILSTYLVF